MAQISVLTYDKDKETTTHSVHEIVNVERDSDEFVTIYADDDHYFVLTQALIDQIKKL